MKVAIVGGGIVGLTTALQLQQDLHNARITVFASSFDNTVSHIAAGIFRIGASYSGPTEQITRDWIRNSYDYYDNIRNSRDAARAGITDISGYIFANSNSSTVKNLWMENLIPIYRRVTNEEFELVGGNWKYGSFFSTLLTQCSLHLPWARQKLLENGVSLVERQFNSFKDLGTEYKFIFNCTGLGAQELCNDRRVVPIRGQVIKVTAPWIKTCFYGELDTYVIPGFNGICTLGGSRGFDSRSTKVCPYEAMAVRDRCNKLLPSLFKAETVEHVVGLRPHRENNVRVEPDKFAGCFGTTVIHNYGHGSYGVCTAPGTAKYAIYWANEIHKSSSAKL